METFFVSLKLLKKKKKRASVWYPFYVKNKPGEGVTSNPGKAVQDVAKIGKGVASNSGEGAQGYE